MTEARLNFIKSVALRHKQTREGDKPITPGETENLGYVMEGVIFECVEEIEKIRKENLRLRETIDSNGIMILKDNEDKYRLDTIEVDY